MSQINVNTIKNKAGTGAPNFPSGATVTGVATATSFVGGGSAITGINASNISSGTIDAARVSILNQNTTGTAAGLTGTPNITVGSVTGTTGTFSGNVSIGGTLTYEDVTNIDSVGIVTAREGVFIPDSKKLQLGNVAGSADLEIFHDATNSYVLNGTGDLFVQAPTAKAVYLRPNNGANGVLCHPAGAVDLYHNGNKKIETSGSGAIVTGILTATTFVGRLENVPTTNKTAAYTAVKADAGTMITNNNASGVTIDQNIFAAGDIISVYNNSGGNISIVQGTGVTLRLVGSSTTGTRTLAQRGLMTVTCVAANEFVCSGGGLT